MSLASSPRPDLLSRRVPAVIPSDQLQLLEKSDSWAVDFKSRPHGQAHIPGHVLETAKQAYRASRGNEGCASPSRIVQDEPGRADAPASSAVLEGVPPSSPERLFPWSPSPSRSQPQQQALVDSSVVHEIPKSASATAIPLPREPRPDSSGAMSSNDEDDLEMALPQAHAAADAPVNKAAARLAPTPTPYRIDNIQAVDTPLPCAQPSQSVVIPGTVTGIVKPCSPKPRVEGRRHRHRMIELTDSPIKPVASATAGRRMPATNMFVGGVSSSHDTTSSSMVPATSQATSVLSRVLPSIETTSDLVPVAPRSETSNTTQGGRGVATADSMQPANPSQMRPLVRSATQAWATEPTSHQSNPYRAFLAEYSDYVACHGGSLWNFVRACVCVDYLRSERMLRECLFDDFVRAFSGGYLQYVARAGPGQEPLPAIEWFNLLSGAPLYSRMVVSSRNLDAILAAFPKEVQKARSIIRSHEEEEEEEEKEEEEYTLMVWSPSPERETSRVTGSMAPQRPGILPAGIARGASSAGQQETTSARRPPSQLLETCRDVEPCKSRVEAPRPPSPQLGSDGPRPSSVAPAPSASARSKRPILSQHRSRLPSVRKMGTAGKRSAEETEIFEFFLRHKLSCDRSVASSS